MKHASKSKLAVALAVVLALFGLGAVWRVGQSVYVIGDEMTSVGGVRKDVRATLADADGEYTSNQYTANGDLRVRDDDANTDAAAIEAAVLHNTRGDTLTVVTVDTWTALTDIGSHRYLQIVCKNATDAATATLNIWGSDDGGTTFYPMVRADTLAKAKDVAIDVGTDFNPTEGAGVTNSDTVVVAVGPATHIYIDAEGGATAGFTYEVGGL